MISAIIVDDDLAARAHLATLLAAHPEIAVVWMAGDMTDAERVLRRSLLDAVFLDVAMAGGRGFDLVKAIHGPTKVVSVTINPSHARAAHERGVFDSLLKPAEQSRLSLTVQRLKEAFGVGVNSADAAAAGPDAVVAADKVYLTTARGRMTELVAIRDIAWIEAVQNYSRVQLAGRKPVTLKRSLAEWQRILPAAEFRRIGKSLIIQIGRLESTLWLSRDQTLLLFAGVETMVPIGRHAAARLRDLLRRRTALPSGHGVSSTSSPPPGRDASERFEV